MNDIHPKQLEAVARVIDPEAFEPMHDSFRVMLKKGTSTEEALLIWDERKKPRKRKAFSTAEKAIRSAFKPLPIEDIGGEGQVLFVAEKWPWPIPAQYYDGWNFLNDSAQEEYDADKLKLTGWLPIPTQESE